MPQTALPFHSSKIRCRTKHDHPDQSFLLGFVEFDDQGKPYNRDQITTLFDRIEMEAQYRDLCIIVFVHGWK
ncbi:MAG TPA: hypothetical protein VH230_04515, partial [Stellaceae bacterium]|nr:hypothetical protein [Stellaceae bacterium]